MNDDNNRQFADGRRDAHRRPDWFRSLWIATETFVFMPAFLGAGLAIGLILGGMRRI